MEALILTAPNAHCHTDSRNDRNNCPTNPRPHTARLQPFSQQSHRVDPPCTQPCRRHQHRGGDRQPACDQASRQAVKHHCTSHWHRQQVRRNTHQWQSPKHQHHRNHYSRLRTERDPKRQRERPERLEPLGQRGADRDDTGRRTDRQPESNRPHQQRVNQHQPQDRQRKDTNRRSLSTRRIRHGRQRRHRSRPNDRRLEAR